ncbi:peptide deformylase [Soonwooa purpurea]
MMRFLLFSLLISLNIAFGQKFSKEELSIIRQGKTTTALPIYQTDVEAEHKSLLKSSTDIQVFDKNTEILINRMKLSLLASGGVGIAAPQVGVNRNVIWVQRFDKRNSPFEYFINPKILWKSEILNFGLEGDLSIKDYKNMFYRSQVIQVQYQDLKGKKYTEIVEGFTAVIFQHEIDHLFGILIEDKANAETDSTIIKVEAYKRIPVQN